TQETRAELEAQMARAEAEAEGIRRRLLYGSGDELKQAVADVLRSCDFDVEDLDVFFGGGLSGDLLASLRDQSWIVECRGLTGSPKETDVSDVVKHRLTWSNLG